MLESWIFEGNHPEEELEVLKQVWYCNRSKNYQDVIKIMDKVFKDKGWKLVLPKFQVKPRVKCIAWKDKATFICTEGMNPVDVDTNGQQKSYWARKKPTYVEK